MKKMDEYLLKYLLFSVMFFMLLAPEITTLLSIIMFSQLITGIIPESSLSVPKIGEDTL